MVNNSNPFLDDDEKEKEDDQDSFLEFLSKSKSFTPFDKALKGLVIDALGGEEEDKKEKGGSSIKIVDGQEYLSEDVRPEQADILGGKTASEMEFTPEYRTEFEKRQKEREKQIDAMEAPPPPVEEDIEFPSPIGDSPDFEEKFYPKEEKTWIGSSVEAVGDFFMTDYLTRENGGADLWLYKFNEGINRTAKIGVAGGVRGLGALPQLAQGLYKYGIGTIEQGIRGVGGLFGGEGFVDYDRLKVANTFLKNMSDGAEEFSKGLEKHLFPQNTTLSENILLITADLMVPVTWPGKVAKAFEFANDSMKFLGDYSMLPNWQQQSRAVATQTSEIERRVSKEYIKENEKHTANPTWQQAQKVGAERTKMKDELLNKGMSQLKDSKGRAFKYEKYGDQWWEYGFVRQPKTRGETLLTQRIDEETGKRVDTLLLRTSSPEKIASEEYFKRLMTGSAVVGGGVVGGTWKTMFEGTEYEDFAYAAALAGAIASPSATMRLVEKVLDVGVGSVQRLPLDLTLFRRFGVKMPGANTQDGLELTLPSIILMGGMLLRSGRSQFGKDYDEDILDTKFGKVMMASSRGIPFYKTLFLNDTETYKVAGLRQAINPETGQLERVMEDTGITELDSIISLHGVNIDAQYKMARWAQNNMPQEYLDSIDRLFQFGLRLEQRLTEIGREHALAPFIITMDELLGAIRLQMDGNITGAMFKDNSFRKVAFGKLSSTAQEANLLTTLRVANQEAANRLQMLEKSMKNLIGNDKELQKIFGSFKSVVDTFITTSKVRLKDSQDYLEELGDKKAVYMNVKNRLEITSALRDDFELPAKLGLDTADDVRASRLEEFSSRIDGELDYAYDLQAKAKDLELEELKAAYDQDLNVKSLLMDLEDLRGQELAEFGNIFPMLKNVSRVKAFGPLKDPVEAAINPIDSIIAYARHNALEMYDEGQLENLLKSIASRLSRNDLSANIYSNKFVDAAGNSKNLNLGDGDLDLAEILANIEKYAEDTGVTKEEYLRKLISNLSGRNDANVRGILNSLLSARMSAGDLHTIRKSLSGWSFRNRKTSSVAAKKVTEVVRGFDQTFENAGITALKDFNASYRNWRDTWHDSFIGQKLRQTDTDKEALRSSVEPDRILEIFFEGGISVKSASDVFNRMFGDLEGYKLITKKREGGGYTETLVKDAKSSVKIPKEEIQDLLDTSFGALLYRTNGTMNISNVQERLDKIQRLKNAGIISEKAAEAGTKVSNILDKASKQSIGDDIEIAQSNLQRIVDRLMTAKDQATDKSLLKQLEKEDSGFGLLEYLAPQGGDLNIARSLRPADLEIQPSLKKLRDSTKKLKEQAEKLGIKDEMNISGEELDEKLRVFDSVPESARIDTRINIVLRDIVGIENTDEFVRKVKLLDESGMDWRPLRKKIPKDPTKKRPMPPEFTAAEVNKIREQVKILEDLRSVLVGTALKKSKQLIKERRVELDAGEDLGGVIPFTKAKPGDWQDRFFALSADIDITTFGNLLDDLQPVLNKINKVTNQTQFTDDLTDLFAGMVAIKGEVPMMDDFAEIPRGLTMPAALSRLYAGFRGVVSWRYLASEQIVREHQRKKALLLHAILTDPEFSRNLIKLINDQKIRTEEYKEFFLATQKIVGPKFAVYNEDTNKYEEDPEPEVVLRALKNFLTLPFRPEIMRKLLLNPKPIRDRTYIPVTETGERYYRQLGEGPNMPQDRIDFNLEEMDPPAVEPSAAQPIDNRPIFRLEDM